MIVDAHVHLLPGRLAEAVRRFFTDRPDANPANLRYPLDHAAVLAMHAADGIGQIWSFPYAHKPGAARSMNEASAETAAQFAAGAVTVVGGATVHPADDDPLAIVVDAVERLGLRVLKLHCSVGAFDVDDARLGRAFEWCGEHLVPIVVHLGRPAPARGSDAGRTQSAAPRGE